MCFCVAAITQFQDLALCVHMSLCNPTHLSDDVRLALSVSSEPVFICVSMCVCIQCGERNVWYCFLGSKGKCKQRKVAAKGEWKSVGVHVCVCGGGRMTSAAGQRAGEGALVSVKVESVTQTSSECTPRSQQSTQALAEALRTG